MGEAWMIKEGGVWMVYGRRGRGWLKEGEWRGCMDKKGGGRGWSKRGGRGWLRGGGVDN